MLVVGGATPMSTAAFKEASWDVVNLDTTVATSKWGALEEWDVSPVTDMKLSFSINRNAAGKQLKNGNTKAQLFEGHAGMSKWITDSVTNMESVFAKASKFNADLSKWNVQKTTKFTKMFTGTKFTAVGLEKWAAGLGNAPVPAGMSSMFGTGSAMTSCSKKTIHDAWGNVGAFINTPYNTDWASGTCPTSSSPTLSSVSIAGNIASRFLAATSNTAGFIYYQVLTQAAATPNAANLIANAVKVPCTVDTAVSINLGGEYTLTANTEYKVHAVATNSDATTWSTVTTKEFKTICEEPPKPYLSTDGTQCFATCPSGQYGDDDSTPGRMCTVLTCFDNCKTCSASNTCDECKGGKYLLVDKSACADSCGSGSFKDSSSGDTGRTCKVCAVGDCATCTDGTDSCAACNAPKFLSLDASSCVTQCSSKQFSTTERKCQACAVTDCHACTAPGTACMSCGSNKYLIKDKTSCVDSAAQCGSGFRGEGTGETGRFCEACNDGCASCSAADQCEVCEGDNYLSVDQKICSSSCSPGSYRTGTTPGRKCVACSVTGCKTCSAADVCDQCDPSLVLSADKKSCTVECPGGSFKTSTTENMCTACAVAGCHSCSGAGNSCDVCGSSKYLTADKIKCTDPCSEGFYGNGDGATGRTCESCSTKMPNCETCTGATSCASCDSNKYLSENKDSCLDKCDTNQISEGTGTTGRECKSASGCDSIPNCKTCSADGKVCEKCVVQYFIAGTTKDTCLPCLRGCDECSEGKTCQKCRDTYLAVDSGACLAACSEGTYGTGDANTGRTCKACSNGCSNCHNATACTQCTPPAVLTIDKACGSGCSPDEFLGASYACEKCADECDSCSSATNCTTCGNGYYRANGLCAAECPAGFVQPITGRVCAVCVAGTHTALKGQTKCEGSPCKPGHYGLSGQISTFAATCRACAAGRMQANAGKESCDRCSPGKVSSTLASTNCSSCAAGLKSNVANTDCLCARPCPPGKHGSGPPECQDCPAGRFCTVAGAKELEDCIFCPGGRWSDVEGASSLSGCTKCNRGRFQDTEGATTACKSCTVGVNFQDDLGEISCKPATCPAGMAGSAELAISSVTESPPCTNCTPGKYSAATGSICIPCLPGQISSEPGATGCENCPAKMTSIPPAASCVCEKSRYHDVCGADRTCESKVEDPSSATCEICPENVKCNTPGQKLSSMAVGNGYWRKDLFSKEIYRCPAPAACINEVNTTNGTTNGNSSNGTCAYGNTGVLCMVCIEDWVKDAPTAACKPCENSDIGVAAGVGFLFLGIFAIIVVVAVNRKYPEGQLRPLLNVWQVG